MIVCDIATPGESGYDLVRVIRRDPGIRHIPVIAVTGDSRPPSPNHALAVGFNAYFEKPIELLRLFRTNRALLSQSATG
jgi:CheY-like chemotaxis protein